MYVFRHTRALLHAKPKAFPDESAPGPPRRCRRWSHGRDPRKLRRQSLVSADNPAPPHPGVFQMASEKLGAGHFYSEKPPPCVQLLDPCTVIPTLTPTDRFVGDSALLRVRPWETAMTGVQGSCQSPSLQHPGAIDPKAEQNRTPHSFFWGAAPSSPFFWACNDGAGATPPIPAMPPTSTQPCRIRLQYETGKHPDEHDNFLKSLRNRPRPI